MAYVGTIKTIPATFLCIAAFITKAIAIMIHTIGIVNGVAFFEGRLAVEAIKQTLLTATGVIADTISEKVEAEDAQLDG